jgi:DNA-binding transcriptional LysR family regulator
MNFARLKYFQKIAELQSLRRAAEVLNISQPALTRQIQVLEHEVGAELFLRARQRLQLTEAGRLLMSRADKVLNEVSEIITEIRRLNEAKRARLVIGAVQSTLAHVLPRAVDQLKKEFPALRIEIRSSDIIPRVITGVLDVGLVTSPSSDPRLEIEPIAVDPFVAVVSSRHRLAAQRAVTLHELFRDPLVTFLPGFPMRDCIAAAALRRGLTLPVAAELDSIEAIKALVRAGVGITLLPHVAVLGETLEPGLKMLRVDADDMTRELVAIRRTGEASPPPLKHLVAAVRRQFPPEFQRSAAHRGKPVGVPAPTS